MLESSTVILMLLKEWGIDGTRILPTVFKLYFIGCSYLHTQIRQNEIHL